MSNDSQNNSGSDSGITNLWSDPSINTNSNGEGSNTVEALGRMQQNNNSTAPSMASLNTFGHGSRRANSLGRVSNDSSHQSGGGSVGNRSIRTAPLPPLPRLPQQQHRRVVVGSANASLPRNRAPSIALPRSNRSGPRSGSIHIPPPPPRGYSTASSSQMRMQGEVPSIVRTNVPPPPPRRSSGISIGSQSTIESLPAPVLPVHIPHAARGTTFQRSNVGNTGVPASNAVSVAEFVGGDMFEKMFSLDMERLDEDIIKTNNVILPRAARGTVGSSTFAKNRREATEGITHLIGVPVHLQSAQWGEEEGNDTKKKYIQDQQLLNTTKVQEMKEHIIAYDFDAFFHVFCVKEGLDINEQIASGINLKDSFDRSHTVHAIKDWNDLTITDVCAHQLMLNRYNDDKVGREWCMAHIKNSITIDLLAQLNLKYDELDERYQGCVTFAWLLMEEVFGSTRETTESLQTFLKIIKRKGLGHYPGENMNQMATEVKAVVSSLHAIGELRRETTKDIATGMTITSVDPFKRVFETYLLEIEKNDLEVGSDYMWNQTSTKGEINYLLNLGITKYKAMGKAGLWTTPAKGGARFGTATDEPPGKGWTNGSKELDCFNCGNKHKGGAKECRKPFDKEAFERRRNAYYEKKRQERGQDSSTTPSNYNRNKSWGAPKQGEAHCKLIDGVAHSFCSKCNGGKGRWVTDHSTNYHAAKGNDSNWTLASLAKLQPQHPLLTMGTGKTPAQKKAVKKKESASGGDNKSKDSIDRNLATAALKRIKNSATTPDAEKVMEESMRALGLDFQ